MKGFSLSRGLRLAADACEKPTLGLGYFRYRWKHWWAFVVATNEKLHLNESGEFVASSDKTAVKTIPYDEWTQDNKNTSYDRVTNALMFAGCAIGVAWGINKSAKKRADPYAYDETRWDLARRTIGGAIGGTLLLYFSHVTLPFIVAGGGAIVACDALERYHRSHKRRC